MILNERNAACQIMAQSIFSRDRLWDNLITQRIKSEEMTTLKELAEKNDSSKDCLYALGSAEPLKTAKIASQSLYTRVHGLCLRETFLDPHLEPICHDSRCSSNRFSCLE